MAMLSDSFLTNLKIAVNNWYLLMVSGVFSAFAGLYILMVPQEFFVYRPLNLLLEIVFITSGLCGAIFSLHPLKYISSWLGYLVYAILIFILGVYLFENLGNSLSFVIGFTSLFRYGQLLDTAFGLKRFRGFNWRIIAFTSLTGLILAILFIIYPLFKIAPIVFMICFSFIMIGMSSILLAIELKKVDQLRKDEKYKKPLDYTF